MNDATITKISSEVRHLASEHRLPLTDVDDMIQKAMLAALEYEAVQPEKRPLIKIVARRGIMNWGRQRQREINFTDLLEDMRGAVHTLLYGES